MIEVIKDIYMVPVPLPGSPLKILNSYIVKGNERHLLIDVGYNADESEAAINNAFNSLGIKLEDTDIFLTHLHGDHTGLIDRLKHKCKKIYISEYDGTVVNKTWNLEYWKYTMEVQEYMGIPEGQKLPYDEHPGYRGGANSHTDFTYVEDGDTLPVGKYSFEVINLKGHTPGIKGLYEKNEKILFGGDHILNKITPNINAWDFKNDYLGFFLESLKRVKEMDLNCILPGHRTLIIDYQTRIDELLEHHRRRLNHIMTFLASGEKTICEIAMEIKWDFATSFFGDFPNEQKWFAANEVFAHLEHLRRQGQIDYVTRNHTYYYFLKA